MLGFGQMGKSQKSNESAFAKRLLPLWDPFGPVSKLEIQTSFQNYRGTCSVIKKEKFSSILASSIR